MSALRLFLCFWAVHGLLVGLDIDSAKYRISIVDGPRKTEAAESMRDRVEESTCISFAEEGRRFDDSPSRVLPSNSTVCGYFPLFLSDDLPAIENSVLTEKWEKDESGRLYVRIAEKKWSSEDLLAMLLEHVREKVEEKFRGKEIEYAISVPRHWTIMQRRGLMELAGVAKMKVLGLTHKSTAIALNTLISRPDSEAPQVSLLFHLSRDSLETTFVSFSTRRISSSKLAQIGQVLSSSTSKELSTKTLDALIAQHLLKQFEATNRVTLKGDPSALQKLAQKAGDVRNVLLAKDQIVITEELKGKLLKYVMKSSELKDIMKSLKTEISTALESALSESGLFKSNLTNLIIAGEDSRNAALQNILQDFFGSRLPMSLNEETSVAKGAAFFAANVSKQFELKTMWMSDVAVEIAMQCGEAAKRETLFPPKTPLPAKKAFSLLSGENQKCTVFSVRNGQDTKVLSFESTGVEAFVKAHSKTPTQFFVFQYDFGGLITIDQAQIAAEGVVSSNLVVTVSESTEGLTKAQVADMTERLKEEREAGNAKRAALEARIKLQSSLRAFRALLHDKSFLRITTEEERSGLVSIVSTTDEWLSSEGKSALHSVVTEKMTKLQDAFKDSHERMTEAKARPEALKTAFTQVSALNSTMGYLNLTKDWIPLQEREAALQQLAEVKAWLDGIEKDQKEKNPWETLAAKTADIKSKMQEVSKVVEKIQKAVKPKPPPPTKSPTTETKTEPKKESLTRPKEEKKGHKHTDL